MVRHLCAKFLDNPDVYQEAIDFWRQLWAQVDPVTGKPHGWVEPWLGTGGPTIRDGNPIFSAYSPTLRKGIRVVQYPPESADVEFDYWLDTFGGDITDPQSVHELVITCALSDTSAMLARDLIESWISGAASLEYSHIPMVKNSVIERLAVDQPEPWPRTA